MMRPLHARPALALVALIVGGCSGAPAQTGPAENAATDHEKAVRFAVCMRDHGVSSFPDPNASGRLTIDQVANGSSINPSAPAFTTALRACRSLEPPAFTGRKRSVQQQQSAVKFAQCMRANGISDFPDPTPNGPIIDTNRIPSAAGRGARDIPGFRTASAKCSAAYASQLGLQRPS